jgi:hypothetical protein
MPMTSSDNEKGNAGAGAPVPDLTERKFNHDLLLESEDRKYARMKWPQIAHILIDEELGEVFRPYENIAKSLKVKVQRLGSVAVLLMAFSLIGSVLLPWVSGRVMEGLSVTAEICAILGLIFAVLVSSFGPWRRKWLLHRFMTEVLRQWHFRRLLNGPMVDHACAQADQHRSEHAAALTMSLQEIRNDVGQHMDDLISRGTDVLGKIPTPQLPGDPEVRQQLLSAYRALRLKHQLNFSAWKLSDSDRTYMWLPSKVLIRVTDWLAGVTLVAALVLSVAHLINHGLEWASAAAVVLAILGVATRAWRDGLALGEDRERYEDMRHSLELAAARWEEPHNTDEARFLIAKEVEAATLDELRGFLRSHTRAQFLF